MSPKEKALELRNKFSPYVETRDFFGDAVEDRYSKKCALIAVDEIFEAYKTLSEHYEKAFPTEIKYWEEVKAEIEAM